MRPCHPKFHVVLATARWGGLFHHKEVAATLPHHEEERTFLAAQVLFELRPDGACSLHVDSTVIVGRHHHSQLWETSLRK